ncbi:MAG: aureocin A53 family class IId bacteriocin [Paraclostridium sordellii]
MWGKIIAFASRYGSTAVKWCWKHKKKLLNAGMFAYDIITSIFG